MRPSDHAWRVLNRSQIRENDRRNYNDGRGVKQIRQKAEKRTRLIDHLGGRCKHIGDDQCDGPLEVDHINNDGKKDRGKGRDSITCRYWRGEASIECLRERLQVLCRKHHGMKSRGWRKYEPSEDTDQAIELPLFDGLK